MRRILGLFIALALLASPANASLISKPMTVLGQVDSAATGLIASASQVMVYGNREKNGFSQILNGQPLDLTCGVESFISAGTSDSEGNFYLVGAASHPIVGTLPPITGVLNPDNVVPDPVSSNKSDAVTVCYWKIDSTGKLIESGTNDLPNAVIPYSVLVDKFGITIAGSIYTNPGSSGFVMNWNSKPTYLGKNSTSIYGIARSADGGVIAVGQSGEKLLDKTLKGKMDGFLAKILNGKVISVQRSSDANASRAWRTTTSNLLLGGYSNSSAVITKFTSNFTPTWTDRYPSNGSSMTAASGANSFGAFVSTGPVKALPTWASWKKKNAILVLTFNSKGSVTAANYVNSKELSGFAANGLYGPLVLAAGFIYRG